MTVDGTGMSYNYCGSSPLLFVDDDGRDWWTKLKAGFKMTMGGIAAFTGFGSACGNEPNSNGIVLGMAGLTAFSVVYS